MSDNVTTPGSTCPSCGHPRTSDAVFCEDCGVQFDGFEGVSNGRRSHRLMWVFGSVVGMFLVIGALVVIGAMAKRSEVTASAETKSHESAVPRPDGSTGTARPAAPATVPEQSSHLENWAAMSHTAMSITGDVQLSETTIIMIGNQYKLTLARPLETAELESAGKITDVSSPSSATLYKTQIGPEPKLVNGNSICGEETAQWILAVRRGESELSVAFFSGAGEPNLDFKVVSSSPALCGTFSYSR